MHTYCSDNSRNDPCAATVSLTVPVHGRVHQPASLPEGQGQQTHRHACRDDVNDASCHLGGKRTRAWRRCTLCWQLPRELALEGCQLTILELQSLMIEGRGHNCMCVPLPDRSLMKATCQWGPGPGPPAPKGLDGVMLVGRVACVQWKHASAPSWPTPMRAALVAVLLVIQRCWQACLLEQCLLRRRHSMQHAANILATATLFRTSKIAAEARQA